MATDYDQGDFAEQYQQIKGAQLVRERVETYSFLKLVGDVKGKKVLDVACGDGYYTRLLRKAGAAEVLGTDISDRMIELAREQEACQPIGVEYRVEDARNVGGQSDFDLVVAAWLLVHAPTRDELAQMCRGLASFLRPGGRFVTVSINPGLSDFDLVPDYRKYGYEFALPDREGAPLATTMLLEDSTLEFEDYYLPIEAYESAFTQAGFRDFAVHLPELSPTADEEPGFWDDFLEHPMLILMDCVKSAAADSSLFL